MIIAKQYPSLYPDPQAFHLISLFVLLSRYSEGGEVIEKLGGHPADSQIQSTGGTLLKYLY